MKVVLIGHGKMGMAVEQVIHKAQQHKHIEIVATYTSANMHTLSSEALRGIDVVIEFTNPLSAVTNIKTCIDAGVPVISGTTGWYAHMEEVIDYCNAHNGTMLSAANFSIGVHIFLAMQARVAQLMQGQPQYSVQIEETHHTQKLDAPSGTAIRIAETIAANMPRVQGWTLMPEQREQAIPVTAHRVDKVPGTHTVHFTSAVDTISCTHTAHSRDGFAEGAWLAAQWIIGKKGVFTMQDVLGI